ncbi:MAG: matrixin family metalloprotease [Myxococcota bacterium]
MNRTVRFAIALLALLFLAGEAHAYVVLKDYDGSTRRWQETTVPWTMGSGSIPGVGDSSFQSALQAAFDAWEGVGCSWLGFQFDGVKTFDPGGGIHVIVQSNSWDPTVGDALAYAQSQTTSDGSITSTDIVFNAATAQWSASGSPPVGVSDVQGVATHEIGHAIGLDHSRHFESTMFFSGGSTDLRSLAGDDEQGACYLYPDGDFGGGAACDSCESNADCADGDCLLIQGWGSAFCGQYCQGSTDCPDGFFCAEFTDPSIEPQCYPANDHCDQAGASIGLGEYCYGHETCSSGTCLVLPDDAYCSQECTSSCADGMVCVGGLCLAAGDTPYGGACDKSSECQTGSCVHFSSQGVCTQPCGTNGGTCPDGNQCLQDVFCVPPGPGANGAPCIRDDQCAGTYCIDGACTQPCGAGQPPCPEGSTCGDGGFCEGGATGGSCQDSGACPDGLVCQKPAQDAAGTCARPCNPLLAQGCLEGEVCAWRWESWTSTLTGTCVEATGGRQEGEACDPPSDPCEADLVCHEGVIGTPTCHKDCKLQANNLGCFAGEVCLDLEDPDDPKRGVCVPKHPPQPDPDPEPDPDPDPEPDPDPDPEPDPGPEPQPEPGPEPQVEPMPEPQAEPGPDAGPPPDPGHRTSDVGPAPDQGGAPDTATSPDPGARPRIDAGATPDPGGQQPPAAYSGGAGPSGCGAGGSGGAGWPAVVLLAGLAFAARRRGAGQTEGQQ